MDESKNILLNKLQEGALFLKFNSDGSLSEGFFYICPKLKSLCYNVSKKRFQSSTNECKRKKTYFLVFLDCLSRLCCFVLDLLKDCEVRAGLKIGYMDKSSSFRKNT